MIQYTDLSREQMTDSLLDAFDRRQVVTRCWRKRSGVWQMQNIAFIDDWNAADRARVIASLRKTCTDGGHVAAAFVDGALKGFASVDAAPLGRDGIYRDLSHMHVSAELRGQGIGRALFQRAKAWAAAHGARKLYISAHSAVESQAFYRAMGCIEAAEYDPEHVAEEPCDCQLECRV